MGWYLGNDLHDVAAVWNLLKDVTTWLESNPTRNKSWWLPVKGGERRLQERLRVRRKLLWEAIKDAAKVHDMSEDSVVQQLDELKAELGAGITRVETWAQDAKKDNSLTILRAAQNYAAIVRGRRPRLGGVFG